MGPRIARASVSSGKSRTSKKKNQKRSLDALAIASHSVSDGPKIRQHRLGESDLGHSRKRQRVDHDEDDDLDEDEEAEGRPQKKRAPKGRFDQLDISEGSDSEGHEWRMGVVDEDDDSDIDSDEAFGESDEERFEGFTFRGSSSNQPKKAKKQARKVETHGSDDEVDLSEGEDEDMDDEEEDDFGDEGVDLATMLDNYSESEEEGTSKKEQNADSDEESFADFDESDDDDAADPEGLSKLQDLISSYQPDEETSEKKQRKADVHESAAPSEFGLTASQKLSLDDLLPTVTDPKLKKSLKLLRDDKKSSKRTGIPGKLEAPLPKRQQDKLDRAAATEKANETLERWVDTVKQNRRAEHLTFPMKDVSEEQAQGATRLLPTAGAPMTELESTIQNILVESGLSTATGKSEEDKLRQFEELKAKEIPLEEVQARRAELRKARELLFREEVRAKRIKKIKSKSYRRVHRKERERLAEKERELMAAEGIDVSENEREYNDRRRAEERMGAKHRESKWAKGVKKAGLAAWDEDARGGVTEMARRNEELRRRMEGKDVRADDEDDSDVELDDDDEDDTDDTDDEDAAGTRRLQRQLDVLGKSGDGKESKISQLAFMKRAEASRKAENDEAVAALRRELAGEDASAEDVPENAVSLGRRKFGGPSVKPAVQFKNAAKNEFEEGDASDNDQATQEPENAEITVESKEGSTRAGNRKQSKSAKGGFAGCEAEKPSAAAAAAAEPEANPWLASTKKKAPIPEESEDELRWDDEPKDTSKTSSKKNAKSKNKSTTTTSSDEPQLITGADGWTTVTYKGTDADGAGHSDNNDDEASYNPFVIRNAALVEQGFAGDDVIADFDKEKQATIADEADKVIDNTLPGWGSWVGDGLSKKERARNQGRFLTTQAGVVRPERRRDAGLDRVIINERRVKKNAKFLAPELPHGFESKQQYERTLRMPKGPEWTTKQTFQEATKPRVMVKQGVILPLAKPMV